MHVYHYSAVIMTPPTSTLCDGIVDVAEKVLSESQYDLLKRVVRYRHGLNDRDHTVTLTITSLTYMGRTHE